MSVKAISLSISLSLAAVLSAAAAPAFAQSDAVYTSPMREQCTQEMAKDTRWQAEHRAQVEADWSYKWHDRESRQFVTNKAHVLWAYAAIWSILAVFVATVFVRQRRLTAEIDALRRELERARKE